MRTSLFLLLGFVSVVGLPLQAEEKPAAFLEQVKQDFAKWDANQDALLSLAEIDHAIASPKNQGATAAAAVAVKRGGKVKEKPVSQADLATSVQKRKEGDKKEPDYEGLNAWAMARLEKANRTLFATQPPQIDAIRQGKTGDCFCLAALRTVLQRDPQKIVQMIQPQADGVHVVQVGDKSITVSAVTDGELLLASSTGNGLWPVVYEKAVGISRIKPDAKDATPFNVVTKGGSAGSMMSVLTGKEIKRWSCEDWRKAKAEAQPAMLDNVREQMTAAQKDKRVMTGGTGAPIKDMKGPKGILYGHGYAVLGYDAEKDLVHLWNPHGNTFTPKGEPGLVNGYDTVKGEFHVPLKELVLFFGGFAFEQPKPVVAAE